jgi:hypothetical protein
MYRVITMTISSKQNFPFHLQSDTTNCAWLCSLGSAYVYCVWLVYSKDGENILNDSTWNISFSLAGTQQQLLHHTWGEKVLSSTYPFSLSVKFLQAWGCFLNQYLLISQGHDAWSRKYTEAVSSRLVRGQGGGLSLPFLSLPLLQSDCELKLFSNIWKPFIKEVSYYK